MLVLGFSLASAKTTSPSSVDSSSADHALFSHRTDNSAAEKSSVIYTNETGYEGNFNSMSSLPIATLPATPE